jgi:sugar phosphate isomerase/epimerase
MLKLAGFADEISPNLDEQIRVCKQNSLAAIELRGVGGRNVLDLDQEMRAEIKAKLSDTGLVVGCIGSPIGKVKINEPWDAHFERFKIAVDAAEYFQTPLVRIFSYYPPEGQSILSYRDEVLRRMRAKVQYVQSRNVTLVHENEAHIYGESGSACLDLLASVASPKLRACFDFANFVVAGQRPMECWAMLKTYTAHIHVKDARWADGKIVPAGQGDGELGAILADACRNGYSGLLSLEPHLAAAGQFSGFSGSRLFTSAVEALKTLCAKNHIPLAGV